MNSFLLRLDTTAPVITWGPVTDANASELMTVLYLVDEPEVVSAELKLADNRVVAATVFSDRITVQLPDDAVEGLAELSALLRDEVGNETLAMLDIPVSGVLPPEPPTYPTLPGPPVETPWRTRTRIVARSRYSVLSTRRLPSRATIRMRTRIERTAAPVPQSGAVVVSNVRVRAILRSSSELQSRATWTVTKRPEGPGAEDELILLGLL